MNRLTEFLSREIGIELWIASLVAIAIITVVVNQAAQLLLRHAARAAKRTPFSVEAPRRDTCRVICGTSIIHARDHAPSSRVSAETT